MKITQILTIFLFVVNVNAQTSWTSPDGNIETSQPIQAGIIKDNLKHLKENQDSKTSHISYYSNSIDTNCNTGDYEISWPDPPTVRAGGIIVVTMNNVNNGHFTSTALLIDNGDSSNSVLGNVTKSQYGGGAIVADLIPWGSAGGFTTTPNRVMLRITTLNCSPGMTNNPINYRITWF